ncbi:hypothetical protein HKX48_008315 [Thoreauomyces humboldtii]|nr:hypothetical protein HKX48_008315 [Thoreauomyces humboldtii]
MGNELDRQNDVLDDIERGVDSALDRVDNLNVKMRKALDGVTPSTTTTTPFKRLLFERPVPSD